MTDSIVTTKPIVCVAIDVTKKQNDMLLQLTDGRKKTLKLANQATAYKAFIDYLSSLNTSYKIGLEVTENYHCSLAYHLQIAGFNVHLISALAAARIREAPHNS